jgi:thiol-disulfide isomerase/thioredoxin
LLTRKGKRAFNFNAEKPDGSPFSLEDLNGKVVFIDVWATWCAPCLEARPKVIDIANKFKDNPNFEVLMVSVDDSREKWLDFLKDNNETSVGNVFIGGGMKKDFGRQFNINYIPNYILIGKQRLIVDAYIKEPSNSVEEMIVQELSK